ncbi:MAG TPA: polymorphic toxin type 47 domain-containing protein [Leptospiraceae bacterium]|nr:polymorphic toxin type 47 domain-containing protein [Leptospiraceae bacterium]HMX32169.1 polymorphic toxin type 47 domain-containing protein [Leptospiraceae bacterium]HMY32239.1 polymorphic toxin type 47 domain-containing protein [Leptospiraceae bacterium]HNA09731.1 polymorphic toxin type 47 domain-containing protein [Leptospiraceae bacterium]HNC56234.1 polymorphic toxin type 47 domain-containing protein [Leptospiraceae bacterium]
MTFLIIIVAALYIDSPSDAEKQELQTIEEKMKNGERLKDWEKDRFVELLWKVKGIRLFTCKSNYITKIGSLTGYKVTENDLDWRGTGKTLDDALKEAFAQTGIKPDDFQPSGIEGLTETGKTVPVEWKVVGIAEVNIDAPHTRSGPDVFHVGYKVYGSKKKVGHIFMDCLPYFREVK